MAQKPPSNTPAHGPGNERLDAAVVTAYERRLAGARAEVPADWPGDAASFEAELDGYVRLHQRVAGLEMPDVAPSVRAIVLGAAVQAVEARAHRPALARLLEWLMRPGPMVAVLAAAAVLLAVAVRPERKPAAQAAPEAVALLDQREPPLLQAAPEAAAEAQVPPAEVVEPAAAAPSPTPEPVAAPAVERPRHTIAAEPASLGPVEEAAPEPALAESKSARKNGLAKAVEPKQQGAAAKAEAPADKPSAPAATAFAQPPTRLAELDDAERAQVDSNLELRSAHRAEIDAKLPSGRYGSAQAGSQAPAASSAAARDEGYAAAPPAAQAPAKAYAPAKEQQAKAEDEAAADKDTAKDTTPVDALRAKAEKTKDAAEREVLLKQLLVAARKSGDAKTEKWAEAELRKTAEAQALARRKAAEPENRKGDVQRSAPVQRAKAAPSEPLPVNQKD